MVELLRHRYGVCDEDVLRAMRAVRRHRFIPEDLRGCADPYGDFPLPIGSEQTISQPFVVAYMIVAAGVRRGSKVLEVGSGSGYVAAVMAEMGAQVYAVERVASLADRARLVLTQEGYPGARVCVGDGFGGWPESAPYDSIIVSCAPESVPDALRSQLKEGGTMVLPVGSWRQCLVVVKKTEEGLVEVEDMAVRFVPMLDGVTK